MNTVYTLLEERKALALFQEPLLSTATGQINPGSKSREEINEALGIKRQAMERLIAKYTTPNGPLKTGEAHLVLSSINDNHSFLQSNRVPVETILAYLTSRFSPETSGKYPLDIRSGRGGSCLTHSHSTQYHFALQSLTLWREIMHNMFKLWYLAEEDLTDASSYYRLRNTGQGLQRMQSASRIGRAMSGIVGKVQREIGSWVGLSVVHLGDRDVPNALIFIDKYNQVPRILTPIVICLKRLEELAPDSELKAYVDDVYGGIEAAQMQILSDFFKHGFDGSGDDGGSCVDGRLTSAWNWCNLLPKKSYYPLFLMTGFIGFDGSFD